MFKWMWDLFLKKHETFQKSGVSVQKDFDLARGGYGGQCIPDDLPTSMPRTGEPPTAKIARTMNTQDMIPGPAIPGTDQTLLVPKDFNYTHLQGVDRDAGTDKPASITNGYDRDILLKGPMLTLHLKAGETRTITGPLWQRVPHFNADPAKFNPSAFAIKAWGAYEVLRDMAAERTRSILHGGADSVSNVEGMTADTLLTHSKFIVKQL